MKIRHTTNLIFLVEIIIIVCYLETPIQIRAASIDSSAVPNLHKGAIELGLAGSLTVIKGLSTASATIRTGTFWFKRFGLVGTELELTYTHANSLDLIDLQVNLSWQRVLGNSSVYPYIAIGGGLLQEWLGSFQQVRYPIGFTLGLRTLVTQSVAIRLEYKLRRILHDPVSNFVKHHFVFGISILFKNYSINRRK